MPERWRLRPLYPPPPPPPEDDGGIFGAIGGALLQPFEAMGGLGRQAGLGVLRGAQWYTQNVVQPIAGLYTGAGRGQFLQHLKRGDIRGGMSASREAWRQAAIPGWAKVLVELAAADPLMLTVLTPAGALLKGVGGAGKLATVTGGLSRAATPAGKALMTAGRVAAPYEALERAVIGTALERIRFVGRKAGLGKLTLAQRGQLEGAKWQGTIENIGSDLFATNRVTDTPVLIERLLTGPYEGPVVDTMRRVLVDDLDRLIRRSPDELARYHAEAGSPLSPKKLQLVSEKLIRRYRNRTPTEFAKDMREKAATLVERTAQGEIRLARAAATGPYWLAARALNSIDALDRGMRGNVMWKYGVQGMAKAFLSFFNYAPFNVIEDTFKTMTAQVSPGLLHPRDFELVFRAVKSGPRARLLINSLSEVREFAQLPTKAQRGGREFLAVLRKATAGPDRDLPGLGAVISNYLAAFVRGHAYKELALKYARPLMGRHGLDRVRVAIDAIPREFEWLKPLIPLRLGVGVESLAGLALPQKTLAKRIREISGQSTMLVPDARVQIEDLARAIEDTPAEQLVAELTPEALVQLVLAPERGITSLDDLATSMIDAALRQIGKEGVDPRVMSEALGAAERWVRTTNITLENQAEAYRLAEGIVRIFTEGHEELYQIPTRLTFGIEQAERMRLFAPFIKAQAQYDDMLPRLTALVRQIAAKVPPKSGVGPLIRSLLDDELTTITHYWGQFRQLRRDTFTGKPLRAADWNAYRESADGIFDAMKADVRQQRTARARATIDVIQRRAGGGVVEAARLTHPQELSLDELVTGTFSQRQERLIREIIRQIGQEIDLPAAQGAHDALRQQLRAVDDAFKSYPEATQLAYTDDLSKALDDALFDYNRDFPNYHNEIIFDRMMRLIFPYWRYEAHRIRWLPEAALRYPWGVVALERYLTGTEDGYIPTFFGMEVNPLRGTILGAVRRLVQRDYPPDRRGFLGALVRATDILSRWGLYPGPQVTGPLALVRSIGEPGLQLGEVLPPTVQTGLAVLQTIPGLEGVVDKARTTFLGDRFREYYLRKELARRGIDPDEATPEQRNQVMRAMGWREILESQISLFRFRPDEERDYRNNRVRAYADVLGVPEETVEDWFRKGKRPESMVEISPAQKELIRQRLEPFELWNAVTLPLREPEAQRIAQRTDEFWATWERTKNFFRTGSVEGMPPQIADLFRDQMRTSQEEDDQLLATGQITGNEWRARRSARKAAQAAAWVMHRANFADVPVTDEERQQLYPDFDLPKIHPVRTAMNAYFAVRPEMFEDEAGNVDWEAFFDAQDAALQEFGPEIAAEALETIRAAWTPTERKFAEVRERYRELLDIPRFINVPKQFEDDVSRIVAAANDLRVFAPNAPRIALLLEAARRLGLNPQLAYLALQARPNTEARRLFRRRFPELALFYLDVPIPQAAAIK